MRWMLLLAVPGLACGGQWQAPSEEIAPIPISESPGGNFVCGEQDSDTREKSLSTDDTVPKVSPEPPLQIGELATLPDRTTPDAACVRLNQDLDYVQVQAHITSPGFTTACQVSELYRIGPAAQAWAVGGIQRFALDYAEILPPGIYTQRINVWGIAPGNNSRRIFASRYDVFAVDSAGLRPRSLAEFQAAARAARDPVTGAYTPPMEPYVPPPPDPCTKPDPYTDLIASETATSRVDVDSWQGVTTIQPLRWYRSVVHEQGAPSPPRLEFVARDADGTGIHWDIQAPTDEPAAFEATGGRLIVAEGPEEARVPGWSGSAMNVAVSLDDPTHLRVQLSNIVLEQGGSMSTDPRVTRTLDSASIVGEWIQQ